MTSKPYTITDDPTMKPFVDGLRDKVDLVVGAIKSPNVPNDAATDMLVRVIITTMEAGIQKGIALQAEYAEQNPTNKPELSAEKYNNFRDETRARFIKSAVDVLNDKGYRTGHHTYSVYFDLKLMKSGFSSDDADTFINERVNEFLVEAISEGYVNK